MKIEFAPVIQQPMKRTYIWATENVLSPETRETLIDIGELVSPEKQRELWEQYGIDNFAGVVIFAENGDKALDIANAVYEQGND